jgi:hypothetical protein
VQSLLGIEPILILMEYAWIASLFLTFWTILAPQVLVFANYSVNSFQSPFADSQR